jgi:hypothetical protein
VDWAVFCSASKAATSKPTNSLSLPDASSDTLVANRDCPFVADRGVSIPLLLSGLSRPKEQCGVRLELPAW